MAENWLFAGMSGSRDILKGPPPGYTNSLGAGLGGRMFWLKAPTEFPGPFRMSPVRAAMQCPTAGAGAAATPEQQREQQRQQDKQVRETVLSAVVLPELFRSRGFWQSSYQAVGETPDPLFRVGETLPRPSRAEARPPRLWTWDNIKTALLFAPGPP